MKNKTKAEEDICKEIRISDYQLQYVIIISVNNLFLNFTTVKVCIPIKLKGSIIFLLTVLIFFDDMYFAFIFFYTRITFSALIVRNIVKNIYCISTYPLIDAIICEPLLSITYLHKST